MKASRRREIGQFASRLHEALGLTIPIDLEIAVERLGGTVDVDSHLEHEAMVEKCDRAFRIVLSADWVSDGRRKFSIAHELGHLFLHMGYLVDEEKWRLIPNYRDSARFRYGYSAEELEANEFAAAFLMPSEEFRSVAKSHLQNDRYDVAAIASKPAFPG